jgi:hypothetical protein
VAAPAPPAEPEAAADRFGFEVRIAWRRDDPRIEADAIDFWTRNGLLLPNVDPAERAKELTGVAYKDGRLVAAATATLATIDQLRARFAILRASTAPAFRRSHAQRALGVPIREAVRDWALANPEEKLAGRIAFLDRGEWGDLERLPVWPTTRLSLAGYDGTGRQVRVDWFEHFLFDGEAPRLYPPEAPASTPPGIELRPAWRRGDARIEADAIALWNRLGALPANVSPEARARELVLGAYQGDRLVGLVTAELGILPQVRARVAMIRGLVDPARRRGHVAFAMMDAVPQILESWAAAHPEERVGGFGGIIESNELKAARNLPYWAQWGFGLIGFNPDGRQIRLAWFDHFRLD